MTDNTHHSLKEQLVGGDRFVVECSGGNVDDHTALLSSTACIRRCQGSEAGYTKS